MSEIIEEISVDELIAIVYAEKKYTNVNFEVKNGFRFIKFEFEGVKCEIYCPQVRGFKNTEHSHPDNVEYFKIYALLSSKELIGDFEVNLLNRNVMHGCCYDFEGFIYLAGFVYLCGGVTREYIKRSIESWEFELRHCLQFVKQSEEATIELKEKMDEIFRNNRHDGKK